MKAVIGVFTIHPVGIGLKVVGRANVGKAAKRVADAERGPCRMMQRMNAGRAAEERDKNCSLGQCQKHAGPFGRTGRHGSRLEAMDCKDWLKTENVRSFTADGSSQDGNQRSLGPELLSVLCTTELHHPLRSLTLRHLLRPGLHPWPRVGELLPRREEAL